MKVQTIPVTVPLRERAARAVCAIHSAGEVCEIGATTADAVLAEVKAWLLEMADTRDRDADEYGRGSGLALLAAGDAGLLRGLAEGVMR